MWRGPGPCKLHSANPTEYFIIWCSQPWKCYLAAPLTSRLSPPHGPQSPPQITVDFVGKLNKERSPPFLNQFPAKKFDIIGVRGGEGGGVVLKPSIITLHRSKLILLTNPSRRGGFAPGEREWARVGPNTGETRDTKSNGKPMYQGEWGRLRAEGEESVQQKYFNIKIIFFPNNNLGLCEKLKYI